MDCYLHKRTHFCSWHSIIREPLLNKTTFFTFLLLLACETILKGSEKKNLSNVLSWGIKEIKMLGVKSLCSQITTFNSLKLVYWLMITDYGQIKPEMFAYKPNFPTFREVIGWRVYLELKLTGLA